MDLMNIMTKSTDECVVFTVVISNNKQLEKSLNRDNNNRVKGVEEWQQTLERLSSKHRGGFH